MLDILPGYYIVFLALGLAAIVVVLFYSFTRNSNYEVQQRAKKIQQKREKDNQTLRMLRDTGKPTDSSLSMEGGRVLSSGYKANGDMRKMRKEGSGLKELEEMGTSK